VSKFILTIFIFLSLSGCNALSQIQKVPQAEVSNPYFWDFGRVKEGQVLKHDFILSNESQKNLNIKDVTTSCGCTASEAKKKTLLPGESTLIEVQFNTKGYSGPVQQYIYVHTDKIDDHILKFIIKAEVLKSK